MKHFAPRVKNERPGIGVNEIASRLLKRGVQKVSNPMVEAIFEEMNPEIDELLARHLGDKSVDLSKMQGTLERAGRVLNRVAAKRRSA